MADNNLPKVILKKKQIPVLIDFCLEESIEFSVRQQSFPETDWEVELKLKDYKTAILVGMFLRENKFEVEGIDPQRYRKSSGSGNVKKSDEKVENAPVTSRAPEKPLKSENTETEYPTLL
jgi:hypothetical protein